MVKQKKDALLNIRPLVKKNKYESMAKETIRAIYRTYNIRKLQKSQDETPNPETQEIETPKPEEVPVENIEATPGPTNTQEEKKTKRSTTKKINNNADITALLQTLLSDIKELKDTALSDIKELKEDIKQIKSGNISNIKEQPKEIDNVIDNIEEKTNLTLEESIKLIKRMGELQREIDETEYNH